MIRVGDGAMAEMGQVNQVNVLHIFVGGTVSVSRLSSKKVIGSHFYSHLARGFRDALVVYYFSTASFHLI